MTRDGSATEPIGAAGERVPAVGILTVLTYLSLLAGENGLQRVGVPNPTGLPEHLVVPALLLTAMTVLRASAGVRPSSATPLAMLSFGPLIYLAVTSLWSPPFAEAGPAVIDLIAMVIHLSMVIGLARWHLPTAQRSLMWCLAVSGIVFAIAGLLGAGDASRVAAFGGGPNVYSRITVLGIVGIVWLVRRGHVGGWAFAAVPALLAATVASGSRGGILAGLVAVVLLLGLVVTMGPGRLLVALAAVATTGAAALYLVGDAVTRIAQGRIVTLTIQNGYTSGRGPLLEGAVELFLENPVLGAGLRAFAIEFGRGFTYPHNLVLHVAAEGGAVGVLLLLAFLGRFLLLAVGNRTSVDVRCWTAAAAVIFTSSMFSGDYYDTRFLWIFIVMAAAASAAVGPSTRSAAAGRS